LAMLRLYQVVDQGEIDELTTVAREGHGRPWWSDYADVVTPQFARYLGYEGMASEFWISHPFLVPGLLHTREYASGLLGVYPESETARKLVELRTRRQQRVFAQSDVTFHFVFGEEGLYRWIGGPAVMRRQLEHLLDFDPRRNVSIRIVPFTAGSHPGLRSPFVMLRRRDTDDEVLFVESVNGDQLIQDDPEQIAEYTEYIEIIHEASMGGDPASALLREQIEKLRQAERASGGGEQ
jgi:hypothetical protein